MESQMPGPNTVRHIYIAGHHASQSMRIEKKKKSALNNII